MSDKMREAANALIGWMTRNSGAEHTAPAEYWALRAALAEQPAQGDDWSAGQVDADGEPLVAITRAEYEHLKRGADHLRFERDEARARYESAVKRIVGIHSLLYPAPVTTADGRTFVFRPKSPDPHEVLQELSDRIRALSDALPEQPVQGEAVATVTIVDLGTGMMRLDWSNPDWWHCLAAGTHALYTAPPAPSVPDGWKLVPVEITKDMWLKCPPGGTPEHLWNCLLAAAPEPKS